MTKAEGDHLGTGNHPGTTPSRSEVSSALSDLLLRVEGATGPNFALEEEIDRVVGKSGLVVPPNYTYSVDSALALATRVLPGWTWELGTHNGRRSPEAIVIPPNIRPGQEITAWGCAPTPALALLAAMLKALADADQREVTATGGDDAPGMPPTLPVDGG